MWVSKSKETPPLVRLTNPFSLIIIRALGGIRDMLKTKILTNVFVVITFVVTFLAFYLAAASNIA